MAKNSSQKKPKFSEILGTKVVQFWCYTKLVKTKNVPLNWYFSTKFFFRKIRGFFDVENWLWKSDFGTFWQLFLAILQVSWKNRIHFLWSVQSYLQSEMFLSNSIDMMKNLLRVHCLKMEYLSLLWLFAMITPTNHLRSNF